MQQAIKAVAQLGVALNTAEDCEKLDIGEKSIEKLQEIISTGEYRRNHIMAQDPHHRTVTLVRLARAPFMSRNTTCRVIRVSFTCASMVLHALQGSTLSKQSIA